MSIKFYTIVPIQYKLIEMEVLMLATSKMLAIKLYENWNDGNIKVTDEFLKEHGLEVREVKVGK